MLEQARSRPAWVAGAFLVVAAVLVGVHSHVARLGPGYAGPCCAAHSTESTAESVPRGHASISIFCATVYRRFFRVTLPSLFLSCRPLAG